ncbi:hypothetical protein [Streptomyces muensis]|uniref:Uncharacterized protein n=1 Tax=Streptomyces muensis TaxID=1077944 RepID=A0A9X1TQG6_STRM4|nr:hypothetical protein [Streptomyces muensis]MCF1599832.1 hypothetical protein [Streptomyces muensis]
MGTLITGCTSSSIPDQSVNEVCDGLLGEDGGELFTELANGTTRLTPATRSEDTRIENVAAAMKKSVSEPAPAKPALKSICTVKRPAIDGEIYQKDTIEFEFGWSRKPDPVSEFAVSSYSIGSARVDSVASLLNFVDLYFICHLASGGEGIVRGKWIGPTQSELPYAKAADARRRIFVAAGAKFATSLGCTNDLDLSPTGEMERLPVGTEFTDGR